MSEPSLLTKLFSSAAQATEGARDRIIASAVDQISDYGVRRFTVDELARRVGLSRVTIYRHFPSKDEVLEAAMLHELRVLTTELQAVVAPCDGVEERIVAGFVFTIGYLRAHEAFQRLLRTEPELILPLLTTQGGPVIAAAREYIAQWAGGDHTAEPTQDVEVLCELLARLIVSLLLAPESAAPNDTEAELQAFGRRYIAPVIRTFAEPAPRD